MTDRHRRHATCGSGLAPPGTLTTRRTITGRTIQSNTFAEHQWPDVRRRGNCRWLAGSVSANSGFPAGLGYSQGPLQLGLVYELYRNPSNLRCAISSSTAMPGCLPRNAAAEGVSTSAFQHDVVERRFITTQRMMKGMQAGRGNPPRRDRTHDVPFAQKCFRRSALLAPGPCAYSQVSLRTRRSPPEWTRTKLPDTRKERTC